MDTKNVAGESRPASQPRTAATSTSSAVKTETTPAKPATGLIAGLTEVLASSISKRGGAGKSGDKIRPNVGYTLVAEGVKRLTGTNIPEQQQVVLRIINGALTTASPVISEPELHKLFESAKADGSLKTKQPAWRIFTYYRSALTKVGALKEVAVEVSVAA